MNLSFFSNLKYVKLLVEHGANVNDVEVGDRKPGNGPRMTPLIAASGRGKLDVVKFLVSKGADINYRNEYGQSALSNSAQLDHFDITYFLLQNGADYKYPIFLRLFNPEGKDSADKWKPVYLKDYLMEYPRESSSNKHLQLCIDFLANREDSNACCS